MAYRRPGIQVSQEFTNLQPALAARGLPNCIIGPSYQIVTDDELGTYTMIAEFFSYVDLVPGNVVDLTYEDTEELSSTQMPLSVSLVNVELVQIPTRGTGYVKDSTLEFGDDTEGAFTGIQSQDILEVFMSTFPIGPSSSVGSVDAATPMMLTSNVPEGFVDMLVGDTVYITGGTDVTAGTYTINSKIDDDNIVLDSAFYTGASSINDVVFNVERTTGTDSAGDYTIRGVKDDNTLQLAGNFPAEEWPLEYKVRRKNTEVDLERDVHYDAEAAGINMYEAIFVGGREILSGEVLCSYRAYKVDEAGLVRTYEQPSDVEARFGKDQIIPQNPLPFGIMLALENTVTPVQGLGLSDTYLNDEALAHNEAIETLAKGEMYALVPLTKAATVHQAYKTFVEQSSLPENKIERVAFFNKPLMETETIQEPTLLTESTTIINTQTDGMVMTGSPNLTSPDPVFASTQVGDIVTIVSGASLVSVAGSGAGEYVVDDIISEYQVALRDFVSTYTGTNVTYYSERKDGLRADGQAFVDQNAKFVENGVLPGMFLIYEELPSSYPVVPDPVEATSGNTEESSTAIRAKVIQVLSNQELTLEQVPGVTEVTSDISYEIEKELNEDELATNIGGYAASLGSRRCVFTWPDILVRPVSGSNIEIEGFYGGCAPAAMTTGLPTQQGFTNLSISGFTGYKNGTDRFSQRQLDNMAGEGVMILQQEVPEAQLYIRHELTTDTSAIKYQEYMVTKNVDFISKFMRDSFAFYIGKYNVVDSTYDELRTTADSVLKYLREQAFQVGIGGVIRHGNLASISEGASIDTINMVFELAIPIPLNNIFITIRV